MNSELRLEVGCLVEKFATSLGFGDVETMKQTAHQFKAFANSSDRDESDVSIVPPSQDDVVGPARKSLCSTALFMSDEEDDIPSMPRRKSRKSRKSVCVLPKMVVSSSEEEDDEAEKGDQEVVVEESDDEIIISKRKQTRKVCISSDDEDSGDGEVQVFIEQPDGTKKKVQSFLDESAEDDPNDKDVASLSKLVKKQTLFDSDETESDGEDSAGSLNDFIASDDGDEDEFYSAESDDSAHSNASAQSNKENDKVFLSSDAIAISDSEDEFENFTFKTPTTSIKQKSAVLKEKNLQRFLTPHSQSRKLIKDICTSTSKAMPGTPAYKREFTKKREQTISELFQLFNKTVFGNQLPSDLQITWNKRMTKTAGFCYYSKALNARKCRIELSDKVIDSPERIRDTLIHELCHAATWLINGVQAGHGPQWKSWAKKANHIHPDLPVISRCHQYEIHTKYTYKCNECGTEFGRHSKSIDPSKHRCGKCGGIPELLQNPSTSSAPKTPNAFSLFVKENFGSVKKSNPGKSHRDVMRLISDKFQESKKK
ncbi:germ cell nuclear acidic protein-like [Clytia hemisphaerica]|uniref:SprT-like domain-containing protein n=1 Tax=Clytia hemisphaerica TaxID=252671 RepID=A0A7M5X5L1_9CNID